jgi:formate-dependent nitrite reductase membrane component NrfD/ferredoxin
MYQRADGIVEFDPEVCIGCKACLQACPYDAIYIDPETHSAAKCHFCSHRTDIGLKPACEVVCPEEAIVSGDLDDLTSTISRLIAREPVSVRKPEQGTAPKLFYIDASVATLTPTAPRTAGSFMWADIASDQARALADPRRRREIIPLEAARSRESGVGSQEPGVRSQESGARSQESGGGAQIRAPQAQGMGVGRSALMAGARVAGQMVQTAYNAQHTIPWHWPVPAYLVTKAIGSGAFMALALIAGLGLAALDSIFAAAALLLALVFTAITTALLVLDLEKPRMFLTILTRPQWKSWLARGAFVLIAFTVVNGVWLLVESAGLLGIIGPAATASLRPLLAWLGFPAALLAAIYTAFLFAQAEGRDLWQSPLLPFHLLTQALVAGAGALLLAGLVLPLADMAAPLLWLFGAGLVVDLFLTLAGEFGVPHASEVAARAAHAISHGHYRGWFWGGGILLGHALPLALLVLGWLVPWLALPLAASGALAAIAGLFAYEFAFVMAPQEIPNS